MIATEHESSLRHHLIHCRGAVPFTTLLAECQLLSRIGPTCLPDTADELRRQLRVLAEYGLATTCTTEEDGEVLEWWQAVPVEAAVDPQGELFQ